VFLQLGNKKALVRLPNIFTDDYHAVDTRVVRDYEIVNNDFLAELAAELAEATGWTFEGCGTLRHNELSFIQLRMDDNYLAGAREYERHTVRFMYGDDKAASSGFAGINYTRIECMNTFMVAISENGILRVRHDIDPATRWKLINAQAAEVVNTLKEQNRMLDLFYYRAVDTSMVQEFIERTFPLPQKPNAVEEMEQAQELQASGRAAGIDLAALFARGQRAQQRFNSEIDLIRRRRNELEEAYARHNARYLDSSYTLYALFQAITYITNHGKSYRGDAMTGILFGGKRAQDIKRGYEVLVEMLG
jgi:hypothetical protein